MLRGPSLGCAEIRDFDELLEVSSAPYASRWAAAGRWFARRSDTEPVLVSVRRRGHSVGGVLLAHRPDRWGSRLDSPGEPGEVAFVAAADRAAAQAVGAGLHRLVAGSGRWVLKLPEVLAERWVLDTVAARLAHARVGEGSVSPRVRIDGDRPFCWHLSRNTRAAVAKARNRAEREGRRLELTWTAGPDEVRDGLAEVMDVHRARNVQLRGWSGLDEPAVAARFEDVVLGHAEEGRARLGRVRIDGSLAAFSVGLVSGGTLGVYANMVSPEYLHFSAGTVLNADTVRHAHETGLEVVDWGRGEQRYKLSGAVELRRLHSLTAWSSDSVRATLATRGLLRARTSQVRRRLGSLVPAKSDIQQ